MGARPKWFALGWSIAILLLSIDGCGETSERAANPDSAAVQSPPLAVRSTLAPEDTVGCELSGAVAHPNPDSLLREFVRRDSAGQFTATTAWFDGAVDCPGHEPGPDAATPVRGYALRELARTDSSVTAEVRWERAEQQQPSSRGSTFAETLAVVRTPYGWRIHSPVLNPKVPAAPPRS